mgnify:CR=1 FL=1
MIAADSTGPFTADKRADTLWIAVEKSRVRPELLTLEEIDMLHKLRVIHAARRYGLAPREVWDWPIEDLLDDEAITQWESREQQKAMQQTRSRGRR